MALTDRLPNDLEIWSWLRHVIGQIFRYSNFTIYGIVVWSIMMRIRWGNIVEVSNARDILPNFHKNHQYHLWMNDTRNYLYPSIFVGYKNVLLLVITSRYRAITGKIFLGNYRAEKIYGPVRDTAVFTRYKWSESPRCCSVIRLIR